MAKKIIDSDDFNSMVSEFNTQEEAREKTFQMSRSVTSLSKLVIYAIHRRDLAEAEKKAAEMRKEFDELTKVVTENPKQFYSGSYKVAAQEIVEALTLLTYVKEHRLATRSELGVEAEHYLLGLCDLSGELVREAINLCIRENFGEAVDVKDFVEQLYGEFLRFDFKNGELRKKFDSIKYELNKLEDMVYDLKMKGKQ